MGIFHSSSFTSLPEIHSDDLFQTGDILLFKGTSILSRIIEYVSSSPYSHVGIILRDPWYISPSLKGLYLIESSFDFRKTSDDHRTKFGVMLHSLEKIRQHCKESEISIYYRKLLNFPITPSVEGKISNIYSRCRNIPYDCSPIDWIMARKAISNVSVDEFVSRHQLSPSNVQKTRSMWCSAFVGYFLTQLGILVSTTPWTILSPKAFSFYTQDLTFEGNIYYDIDKKIN